MRLLAVGLGFILRIAALRKVSCAVGLSEDVGILLGSGWNEARARLARIQLAVSHNTSIGIDSVKDTQYLVDYLHLLGSAVVLETHVCRKAPTAFIADSDALRIEALDMTTSFCNGTAVVQRSVATHEDMIARVLSETACLMTGREFLD